MVACDGRGAVVESQRAAPPCAGLSNRSPYKDQEDSHAKPVALRKVKGTPSRAGWPAWFKHFRSDDLDEVRAYVDRDVGPHFRIAHQPGPVGFDMHVAAGQTLTVGWNSVAVGKTIRGRTEHPVLHLDSPPGTVFRLGRQVLKPTVAGAATLTGAGCEFTRSSPAGQLFVIQMDSATLGCEISARQGGRRAPGHGRWRVCAWTKPNAKASRPMPGNSPRLWHPMHRQRTPPSAHRESSPRWRRRWWRRMQPGRPAR